MFLEASQNPQENTCARVSLTQVVPWEFCEVSKDTFFTEHLWTVASVRLNSLDSALTLKWRKFFFRLHNVLVCIKSYMQFNTKCFKTSAWKRSSLVLCSGPLHWYNWSISLILKKRGFNCSWRKLYCPKDLWSTKWINKRIKTSLKM